jgi:hypothetical protein
MNWLHTLSIIATVIGGAYYIHRDIREDMKSQTARTDRLYEMFIQVQNEIKDLHGRSCIVETKLNNERK